MMCVTQLIVRVKINRFEGNYLTIKVMFRELDLLNPGVIANLVNLRGAWGVELLICPIPLESTRIKTSFNSRLNTYFKQVTAIVECGVVST